MRYFEIPNLGLSALEFYTHPPTPPIVVAKLIASGRDVTE